MRRSFFPGGEQPKLTLVKMDGDQKILLIWRAWKPLEPGKE